MKKMKRSRLAQIAAALALLAALLCAPAQAVTVDPTGQGVGFTSILYDNSNGLPTSEANAIVQTAEGFIWIGSYSGLIRYDGNTFYSYDASTGVASVVSLYADSQNRLWIGTNDSGVACMQDAQFRFYNQDDGLASLSVRAIIEDDAGNVLLGTTMGIAYVDTEGVLHPINDALVNREYICEFVSSGSVIYGVTNSGDIFTVENLRVSGYYSGEELLGKAINTICPDPENDGFVYLGMLDSEVIYGDLTKSMAGAKHLSVEPHTTINAICVVNGDVWLCADNGVGFFHNGTYVPILNVPLTNSIDHMMLDYEENLWFTSSRQGVMKIVQTASRTSPRRRTFPRWWSIRPAAAGKTSTSARIRD
ncbi:MAG: hypothetical protein IKN53_03740 [Oscillibacter sp.]|nr:hypothetical protein [Oscillibacter sp.]